MFAPRGSLTYSCWPGAHHQHARRPDFAGVLQAPVRHRLQPRHPLAAQRRLAGQRAPLLLPGGIGASPRRACPPRLGKTAAAAPRTAAARAAWRGAGAKDLPVEFLPRSAGRHPWRVVSGLLGEPLLQAPYQLPQLLSAHLHDALRHR